MKLIFRFSILFLCVFYSCKQQKRYHDERVQELPKNPKLATIVQFQNGLNQSFKDPDTSPLPDRYRKDFEQLDFFPPDTNYVVEAHLRRTPDAKAFLMPTTTARKARQILFAIASFELNGRPHELEVYQSLDAMAISKDKALFIPFFDETNGRETYSGGRYIDLKIPENDLLVIDFNRAYNPYCVYNKKYSCPLVPRQNYMRTSVRAGVKDFRRN